MPSPPARSGGLLCLLPLVLAVLAGFFVLGEGSVNMGYPTKCFFSVAQSASGSWWFVDPSGNRFLSLGVTTVSWWGDTSTNGSKPYYTAVSAKFNNNQSAWADSVVNRLQSWNINSLGAWADTVVITKGLPYTRILGLGKASGGNFTDVFDPAWEAYVDSKAASLCTPLRNDPTLIGYFLDNELFWGQTLQGWNDWRYKGSILDQLLIDFNKTSYSYARAVSFVKGKYSTIQALNKAWNTTYTSFDTIDKRPTVSTSAYTNDTAEFAYIAAVQFFSVAYKAIKKYDPNHLILGVKFAGAPSAPVLKACGEYNDVISLDYYPDTSNPLPSPAYINQIYAYTQKPLLIGEFAYKARDSGLPNTKGAGLLVDTQAQRAQGYTNYTTILSKVPSVIGFHWFEWFDEPYEGRNLDGEDSNFGLVNIHDETYQTLTSAIKATNPTLYGLHEATTTGLPAAQCVSALSCLNDCSGNGCCDTNTGKCTCNTGFSSADCSTDNSKFQVSSFGSAVDTTVWSIRSGGGWGSQTFGAEQTSTSSGQVKLGIAPCTSGSCSFNFTAGSIQTKSSGFGYGVYSALIKAPASKGFYAQLEITSPDSKDQVYFSIPGGGQTFLAGDYVVNGKWGSLFWTNKLPIAAPSADFHNYSIDFQAASLTFYVDGVLLGSFNATTAVNGLPTRSAMAIWLYTSADSTAARVTDATWAKSVSYRLTNASNPVCASSEPDKSAAPVLSASHLATFLLSLVLLFLALVLLP